MGSLVGRLAALLGMWTACTAAPPVAYLVGGPFDGGLTAVDAGVVVGLFAVGAGGAAVGCRRLADPATRFRDGTELGGLLGLAGATMIAAFPVSLTAGLVAAVPFGVGGAAGFLTAFLVGYVADRTVVDRSRAASDHRLVWRATKRPEATWVRGLRVGGAVAAFVVAVLVGTAGGRLLAAFWALVGLFLFGHLVASQRHRRYELVDDGLITAFGFLPWSQFDAFEPTDDALLLYGSVWPFGTIAYDRASIDDPEAVVEALDRYLPRQEADHQDPSVVDRFRELLSS